MGHKVWNIEEWSRNREIRANLQNVEVRSIIPEDSPKYVDAYIFHAEDETGRELTQPEIDKLNENYDTVQYWVRETLNNQI